MFKTSYDTFPKQSRLPQKVQSLLFHNLILFSSILLEDHFACCVFCLHQFVN